jgi:hypothetical protein
LTHILHELLKLMLLLYILFTGMNLIAVYNNMKVIIEKYEWSTIAHITDTEDNLVTIMLYTAADRGDGLIWRLLCSTLLLIGVMG